MKQKYEILISVTNLIETGVTPGPRGVRLRGLMTELMGDLRLIKSPEEILKSALRAVEEGSEKVVITEPITAAGLQSYFSSEPDLQDQVQEQRERNRQSRREQRECRRAVRQDMADMGVSVEEARKEPCARSATRFIKSLSLERDILQDRFAEQIEAAGGTEAQIGRASEIARDLELWCLYALCQGAYEYMNTIEPKRVRGGHGPPSLNDARQAVYLAAAGTFVTDDWALRKLLRVVSVYRYGWRQKRIISYGVLRAETLKQ